MAGVKIGLARVSTKKQAQDISIAAQGQALLKAGCDQVITVRESGFKGPRRGWHELRKLVASGKVTEVLCIDQSRLARDGSDMQFLEECAVRGVVVRALTGGVIETESVGGFIQAGLFSVMNQALSRQIALKTKDGLDRRKADGFYACGRVPFGYTYDEGKVVPHKKNWPIARQMFLDLLAVEMNINRYVREKRPNWSPPGIRKWVQKPILRGIVPRQEGGVKPLISPEEWSKAQRLLQHRSGSPSRSTTTVHLLTGLVRCESCGRNLKYKTVRPGAEPRIYCANPGCGWYGRGIAVPRVRLQLLEELRAVSQQMQAEVEQSTATMDHEKSTAQVQAENKVAQLEALQASGVPELETALRALRDEIAAMAAPSVGPDWSGLAQLLATPGVLDRFPDKQLRSLLLEYVTQIFYVGNPREVQIVLKKGQ